MAGLRRDWLVGSLLLLVYDLGLGKEEHVEHLHELGLDLPLVLMGEQEDLLKELSEFLHAEFVCFSARKRLEGRDLRELVKLQILELHCQL
jgi:hypothetical protein